MKAWTKLPHKARLRVLNKEFKKLQQTPFHKRTNLQMRRMNVVTSMRSRLKKAIRTGCNV